MQKFFSVMIFMALITGSLLAVHQSAVAALWMEKVDDWVLETAAAQDETEFLVYLTEQADLSDAANLTTKQAKGEYVYQQLTAVAQRTQPDVIAALTAAGVQFQLFWAANMIWVKGDTAVIQALAQRPDVAHLFANPEVQLDEPTAIETADLILAAQSVEWNIALVNADDVWADGITGQGIVIGGQDTGYDWDHEGLINQYRGWDGAVADHNYNWHDAIHSGGGICGPDSAEPCDDHGHGTHTMGTMVGNDLSPIDPNWPAGADNAVGMAPGARWIGCRNMNVGVGSPATYAECYQWFIAPTDLNGDNPDPSKAPHVINNSWSCPVSEGCTDPNVLLAIVENVRAAGILTAHSAGNSGSCNTINEPAAIYDASFTVGATTSIDTIASFSSRGPVTVDGSNRLKPDISAPGQTIRSTTRNDTYGYKQGTSMAAPHVAGMVALLLDAEPALTGQVDQVETLIQQTAVPLTTTEGCGGDTSSDIPNHTFGYGRIDAWSAYQSITTISNSLSLNKFAIPNEIQRIITYNLTIRHYDPISPTHHVILTDVLPANTTFVTATIPFTLDDGIVEWHFDMLSPREIREVNLVVSIPQTTTDLIIENSIYGVRSDEVSSTITGTKVTTLMPYSQMNFFPIIFNE